MQTVNDIRKAFLDFFARNGHAAVESSPLVPRNDPTLMFTNAGMVQFKNVFTGAETRAYRRATTAQKCVRAGGKHNDLENVGHTARHHTFFEMLGNFSFGDYFKEEAISFAWQLVTKDYGLAKERLCVTVYAEDDEAFALWRKISGLPENRIVRIPTSDNFWAMGDTGPCGPCSEIFYDHGEHIWGGPPGSPEQDGDRFVEIWNLVFMQYEQVTPAERRPLPRPSIDTGMGLERIAAVMQGTHDNYDTDLLRALIVASAETTRTDPDGEFRISHRVIADHLRASCFLIGDGVLPSNEGRGYVLRRIMRRAMRHAHMIGYRDPLMWRLVPALIAKMGHAYPELERARPLIEETLKLEESRFKQTLERGLRLLDEATGELPAGRPLPGDVAFKLYDTYGFPLDLTQDALKVKGIAVDVAGFDAAMARQKAEARKAWAGSGEAATEGVWFEIREEVGATEFLGYDTESAEAKLVALVADGRRVDKAVVGQEVFFVVNQTPFYGESGGQVGDRGRAATAGGARLTVTETHKKIADLWVHQARVEAGTVAVGDDILLEVDHARRGATRANHSVTHLLHAALRARLGGHVTQKGSLVSPERMRFDVSHPKVIAPEELAEVEAAVNAQIRGNGAVTTRLMDPEAAVKAGAMALFGEKYGDRVRVVDVPGVSKELCGGTHVRTTGQIGLFYFRGESGVAAGMRRIEAFTGPGAYHAVLELDRRLTEAAETLRTNPEHLARRIEALLEEKKRLEKQMEQLLREGGAGRREGFARYQLGDIELLVGDAPVTEREQVGLMMDKFRAEKKKNGVWVMFTGGERPGVHVSLTDELVARGVKAGDLVARIAAVSGGKGGGRPHFASGGLGDPAKLGETRAKTPDIVRAALAQGTN